MVGAGARVRWVWTLSSAIEETGQFREIIEAASDRLTLVSRGSSVENRGKGIKPS